MKPGGSGSGTAAPASSLLSSQPGAVSPGLPPPPPSPFSPATGLGIRGRLFVVLIVLVLAVELISGVYLANQLHAWGQSRAEAELLVFDLA